MTLNNGRVWCAHVKLEQIIMHACDFLHILYDIQYQLSLFLSALRLSQASSVVLVFRYGFSMVRHGTRFIASRDLSSNYWTVRQSFGSYECQLADFVWESYRGNVQESNPCDDRCNRDAGKCSVNSRQRNEVVLVAAFQDYCSPMDYYSWHFWKKYLSIL